jgi:non-lysosomal glucosylceramidase
MRGVADAWYRQGGHPGSPGPRVRRGADLAHVAFPLGGIGTGSISIDGGGRLRDFEVFNRPAKGTSFDYTFLTLHARPEGGDPITRVLQGPLRGQGLGEDARAEGVRRSGVGLPHFLDTEFTGRFPFAEVQFRDPAVPLDVQLEAFNPFIPLEPDDSGLPLAWLNVNLGNRLDVPIDVVLYANLENRVGYPDVGGGRVEYLDTGEIRGLRMSTNRHRPDSPRYGSFMLATNHPDVIAQTRWHRGPDGFFYPLQDFWDQVVTDDFRERREPTSREDGCDVGSIGLRARIPPGGSNRLPVWLVWHTPNFEKYWGPVDDPTRGSTWRNYYAVRFANAQAVAEYVAEHADSLEARTRQFADALWASTLPEPVLDAISSQLSTLRTTTCLRLEDGTFWAWEGCDTSVGLGEGTCSHVWNYAQALPYLFPTLERSIRDAEYTINLHSDGHMTFRTPLPLGTRPEAAFHAAADGQLGGVLRTYRDWLISGDDQWLRAIWPSVRRSLEYAWIAWDRDRDGVAEGLQHNTYDIEFLGPNPMIGTLYLAALEAAARLADRLEQREFAAECRDLRERGSAWLDDHLYNGEYYVQEVRREAGIDAPYPTSQIHGEGQSEPVFQFGTGCLSDQLIGQWYAFMLDLGLLLERDHVISAARAIFRHNWRPELSSHPNALRILAHEDEAGMLVASWPRGGRPAMPVQYCDEVWTGIEYEAAALLTYVGLTEEALVIVKACRDRYSGTRRNPWSDMEYGNHYARGMAAYSLLLAFSGFAYSAPDRSLSFRPSLDSDRFQVPFSVGSGWGILYRSRVADEVMVAIQVLEGSVEIERANLPLDSVARVTIGGEMVYPSITDGDGVISVSFSEPVVAVPGRALVLLSLPTGVEPGRVA